MRLIDTLDNLEAIYASSAWKDLCNASSPRTWAKYRRQCGVTGSKAPRFLTARQAFLLLARSKLDIISPIVGCKKPKDAEIDIFLIENLAEEWAKSIQTQGKSITEFLGTISKLEGRQAAQVIEGILGKGISERTLRRKLSAKGITFRRRKLYTHAQVCQMIRACLNAS